MAQREVDRLNEELQRLELKIEAKDKELQEARIAKQSPEVIADINRRWERLVKIEPDTRQMLSTALQARLASPTGEVLPGLRA